MLFSFGVCDSGLLAKDPNLDPDSFIISFLFLDGGRHGSAGPKRHS